MLLLCYLVLLGVILLFVVLVLVLQTRILCVILCIQVVVVGARNRVGGLFFGGNWVSASNCGSRFRVSGSSHLRSHVHTSPGGRGARIVLLVYYSVLTGLTFPLVVLVHVVRVRPTCVLTWS